MPSATIGQDLVSRSEGISHLELIRFYDLLVRVEDEMRLHHNPHCIWKWP